MRTISMISKKVILLCLIVIAFSSCHRRNDKISKQLTGLYSNTIVIPFSDMDTLIVDTTYLSNSINYQLLVYIDSSECTPCFASHHQEWEYVLMESRKYEPNLTLTIIIDSKNVSEDIKEKFLRSEFPKSIFIDKKGTFRKINPAFPESTIMHVLLLDKNNKVKLVGNPLKNKKIEELLYSKLGKT